MQMSEQEKQELAGEIAAQVLASIHSDPDSICPLGMTSDNVRMVQRTSKLFFWGGTIVAATLIGAFVSGFVYVIWEGFKVLVRHR